METLATKRGRQPTGRTTLLVRIPKPLKSAVDDLIAHYRQAKVKAWEAAPLKQPEPQPNPEATP